MKKVINLSGFKQEIKKHLPKDDQRTKKISHLEFFTGTMLCFFGGSKSFSLGSMRRFLILSCKETISRSSFWERLSGNRFNKTLKKILKSLIRKVAATNKISKKTLSILNVKDILLIDSSSNTLWDGSKDNFPGTRTNAGVKLHASFSLLTGLLSWFSITSTSRHDSQEFPKVKSLYKKLIIFDLGYWDYNLLGSISKSGGYFLSRIKSNTAITIKEAIFGIGHFHTGKRLSQLKFAKTHRGIIEATVTVSCDDGPRNFRAIAVWNKLEKKYHWYITNLKVSKYVIRTLYRCRWQVELIFKAQKRTFNLDQRQKSNNKNITESLIMLTLIANYLSVFIVEISKEKLKKKNWSSISFQIAAQIVSLMVQNISDFLLSRSPKHLIEIIKKVKLLAHDLISGNNKNGRQRNSVLSILEQEIVL